MAKPFKIILVHGIHAKEGSHNMAVLWPHLQENLPENDVLLHEYGFMGFWKARRDNLRQAERLAARIDRRTIVVTHSNGAAIAYLACNKLGARPAGIININPALDRWRTAHAPWVETIHSPGDRWVWLSQWLPFHIWGDQGRVGYQGRAQNTISHNAWEFGPGMRYEGHLGLFEQKRIGKWAAFIALRILERIDADDYREREAARLRELVDEVMVGSAA